MYNYKILQLFYFNQFFFVFFSYEDEGESRLRSCDLRPRARHIKPFAEAKEGDRVMINYNMDMSKQRGYWYDAVVLKKKDTRTVKELICTIYFGYVVDRILRVYSVCRLPHKL